MRLGDTRYGMGMVEHVSGPQYWLCVGRLTITNKAVASEVFRSGLGENDGSVRCMPAKDFTCS